MAAGSGVRVQLEGGPYAWITPLVAGASGLSEGAWFRLRSKRGRVSAEQHGQHVTLLQVIPARSVLPSSLKQALGREEGNVSQMDFSKSDPNICGIKKVWRSRCYQSGYHCTFLKLLGD